MSEVDELLEARKSFRQSATGYWAAIRQGDAELADRQTEAGDAIVATWRGVRRLGELLGPLLDDASPELKYAAAAHLLGSELSEQAVSVLEALQSDPKGLVAPTARLRLMTWRRKGVT